MLCEDRFCGLLDSFAWSESCDSRCSRSIEIRVEPSQAARAVFKDVCAHIGEGGR